jgi:hypothetical protein
MDITISNPKGTLTTFGMNTRQYTRYSPTNPHWARVVGYGPFSLCVIPKEGLCSSSGDINRLMMITVLFPEMGQSQQRMLATLKLKFTFFYSQGNYPAIFIKLV